jgi:hypothetical protein
MLNVQPVAKALTRVAPRDELTAPLSICSTRLSIPASTHPAPSSVV